MSDYETAQRRRNLIVGIFVVLALTALVVMIWQFGDLPTAVSRLGSFEVFVQFPTAPGVQRDTPLRFCGYQIGRVTEVMPPSVREDMITGEKYHQTVVILSISGKYTDIPSNVEPKLMTRGLGSSYIELKLDPKKPLTSLDPNRPMTKYLIKGLWLQGSAGMTSEFFPEESQKKLEQLVDGLRALIANANDIIGDPNSKQNLKRTLANLTAVSEEATHTVRQATQTLENFGNFAAAGTTTMQSADAKFDKIVSAMVHTSEELGKATSELRVVLEKINSGEGSAARFVNDGKFYESLLENTQQIQLLLEQLNGFVAEARDKGIPLKLK